MVGGDNATTILIVEDEPWIRLAASDEISDSGFNVIEAANGAAALCVLESRPDVKLVFTDIVMPGEPDGLALANVVHGKWPQVRILITSAINGYEDRVPDGASFLRKPYTYPALLAAVNALLKQPDEKPEQGSRFVPQSNLSTQPVEDELAVAQPVMKPDKT